MKIKVNYDWTHFKYLGIPIAKNSTNSTMWGTIIHKIKNIVHLWGIRWLNLVGKRTLIQSFLSSYPIYSSSINLAPKCITNNINLEISKFFWRREKVLNKIFLLVKLDTVKESISKGGLGMRHREQIKKSLRAKLI